MDPTKNDPHDLQELRRHIEELRQRLNESAKKGKQLSWDTELLVKKTQNVAEANKVSCTDPTWREKLEKLEVGPDGIWIGDVRTVEDIEFVAAFAALRQMVMTYGNRSFHLEPRKTGEHQ